MFELGKMGHVILLPNDELAAVRALHDEGLSERKTHHSIQTSKTAVKTV